MGSMISNQIPLASVREDASRRNPCRPLLCRLAMSSGLCGSGAAVSLRTAGGSSEVPSQNALVRWNDPPGLVAVGTDREVSFAGSSAPARPGALARHPGAQCRFSSPGCAGAFGVAGRVIGGGLYAFPLSSSLRLGSFIGAVFCRGCGALSELWCPPWSGCGAERSGLDRPLFARGWFGGRTFTTARVGPVFLS